MTTYAALDVSQEATAICVVDESGRVTAEKKVTTCPEVISTWLGRHAAGLVRVGMETGPLAVWLWNELHERGVPIICLDARHAHAALKMRPNKTDRNDAVGLAQIVRTVGSSRSGSKAAIATKSVRFSPHARCWCASG